MKKFLSKIIVLLIILNTVIPFTVYASSIKKIYNCGERMRVSEQVYNNKIYINVYDLWEFEIETEDRESYISLYTYSRNVGIYRNSNIIMINGMNLLYNDPIIEVDNKEYVSLELIAMAFSQIYEVTEDSVNLWITYIHNNHVKGIISLPNGKVAPAGGVEVEVYVSERKYNAGGGKPTPTVGYDGVYRNEENLFNYSDYNLCRQNVIIEEGKNSAEFFLSGERNFSKSSYICYKVNSNGYVDEGRILFNYEDEILYNITLCEGKKIIEGSVQVATPAESDTEFCIIAYGKDKFKYYGVISEGETKADFIFSVADCCEYKLNIVFNDKKYMRTQYPETVNVSGNSVDDVNFYCKDSLKTTVNITVPDNISSTDSQFLVFMQSAESPYYYLDVQVVEIPEDGNNVTVQLVDDYGYENVICFYELSEFTDGLYDFGFYNSSGTVTEVDKAETVKAGSEINIDAVEANSISLKFKLPEESTAKSEITADIQLLTAEGKKRYHVKEDVSIIEYKNSEGTVNVSVPKDCEKYYLRLMNISGDDNYYSDIYYKNNSESTVFSDKKTAVDVSEGFASVMLMKQNKVYGTVEGVPSKQSFTVWASGQYEENSKLDTHESKISICTDEFGDDGSFCLKLPDEVTKYIFMLQAGHKLYYSSDGMAFDIEYAEIIDVTEDCSNINLVYESEYPLQLKSYRGKNGELFVNVKNVSGNTVNDITVYAGFYSKDGRLEEVKSETIPYIDADSVTKVCFYDVGDDIKSAYSVNVYAWNNNMKPCSLPEIYKKNGVSAEYINAMLWMQADNEVYCVGEKEYVTDTPPKMINGMLMATLRPFAEALAMNVSWDNSSQTAEFILDGNNITVKVGEVSATCNGNTFKLSQPACIIDDRVYVPVEDIAEKFGFMAEFYQNTNELFIYPGDVDWLNDNARKRSVIPQYILEKDKESYISQKEAWDVIASICECITLDIFQKPAEMKDYSMTNEEFITLLYDNLIGIDVYFSGSADGVDKFYDDSDISRKSKEAVYELKAYGALEGIYNIVFEPDEFITTGQVIGVCERVLMLAYDSIFPDVSNDSIYRIPIMKLKRLGIMNGYEDGTFKPDGFMYRSEIARLISVISDESDTVSEFECSDVQSDHWAKNFIAFCVNNGIMELENNQFRPDECITNAEVISALLRFLGYRESYDEIMNKALSLGMLEGIEELKPDDKSRRKDVTYLIWKTLTIKGVL